MIVDAALGRYGDLFETFVVLDDMVEVVDLGLNWAPMECTCGNPNQKDLECLKAEGFAIDEATVRECVLVGALNMAGRNEL